MATWDERAELWSRLKAQRSEVYGPATEMMLDLADLRTGNRVLDVAAGTGDQTLLAARRVGPNGYVLAIDISTNMLNTATDAVRRAGLTNVETRIMNADNLDLEADSFDAIICRLGLHSIHNHGDKALAKAMREMHRVVKPGGNVAAIVMSAEEKNPYQGIPSTVAHRWGYTGPSIFVLGQDHLLEDAFRNGGFSRVSVHAVTTQRRFSSSTEVIRDLKDDIHGQRIARLPDAEREQAWTEIEQQLRPFEGPNGCEVPGEVLIGVGTK